MGFISAKHQLVFRNLLNLLIPQLLVFVLTRTLSTRFDISLPTWVFIVLQVISLPLIFACRVWANQWNIAHKAARWDAILPPLLVGKSVGSYDLLIRFLDHFNSGYMGDGLSEWLHEFKGTFTFRVLWDSQYITSDVNIIKSVLATDFIKFEKGEAFQFFMHSVLGTGVFNSDGEMWKFHRAMTRPFFSKERISHFELFDKHAEEAITKMKGRFRAGYALDFQDLIARYTLDAATEFLFGSCVHSLSSELPYPSHLQASLRSQVLSGSRSEEFATAFLQAQEVLASRGRTGWSWPWFELFQSKTAKSMQVVDAYLRPILKEAVEKAEIDKPAGNNVKASINEDDESETLLDHLVKYTTDPVVLHDETLNILIAGRDTTAASLTFAVYFLCMYPTVCERLRKEILDVVGPTRRPNLEDIRAMKYLRAVINETLRLYPAVPFNVRCANQDTTLPNPNGKPFFVPAQTPVSYSVYIMHRRTDYWGPDAQEFDPDRFIDERVTKYLIPNPFIFLPFNAGPRICLGQQFAYNEMSFFLVKLLQNFSSMSLDLTSQPPETRPPSEWKGLPGRKGVEEFYAKSHLTSYAYGGLWVKMDEADTSETA